MNSIDSILVDFGLSKVIELSKPCDRLTGILIIESAKNPGWYQAQFLTRRGLSDDNQYPSLIEAIVSAVELGYSVPAYGLTDEFQEIWMSGICEECG